MLVEEAPRALRWVAQTAVDIDKGRLSIVGDANKNQRDKHWNLRVKPDFTPRDAAAR